MITRRGVLAALLGAAAAEIILPPARTIFLPPRGGWLPIVGYQGVPLSWYDEITEVVSRTSGIPANYLNGVAPMNPWGTDTQVLTFRDPGDWLRYPLTVKDTLS